MILHCSSIDNAASHGGAGSASQAIPLAAPTLLALVDEVRESKSATAAHGDGKDAYDHHGFGAISGSAGSSRKKWRSFSKSLSNAPENPSIQCFQSRRFERPILQDLAIF